MSEQSSERQVWNKADALGRLMNNEALVEKVATMYICTTPDQIHSLKMAASQENLQEAGALAHTLKGASSNLGGELMADLCAAIEQAARNGDAHQVAQLALELDSHCQHLIQALS